jgi:hypothetical protein
MASLVSGAALTSWVNDYLASWSPYEIAGLPQKCRPRRLIDADDIEHWYLLLSEGYCAEAALGANGELYLKMLSFFSAASQRARELGYGSPVRPPPDDSQPTPLR